MQHNYDICASVERCAVASFLIGAVTFISIVGNRDNTKLLGKLQRLICASVVNKNDVIYYIDWDFGERPLQRQGCIVSRKDDAKLIRQNHDAAIRSSF